MNKCRSCGRMLKADEQGKDFCKHCVDENGKLKTYDEVASNLASYLMETQGLDERASANAAKAIVSSQPVWEKKQGVYFEGDMKRKRNTIIALIVVFAIVLSGVGIGTYIFIRKNENTSDTLDKRENIVKTNKYNEHTVFKLSVPGYQYSPTLIGNEKKQALIFASEVGESNTFQLYSINLNETKVFHKYPFSKPTLVTPYIKTNDEFIFTKTEDMRSNVLPLDDTVSQTYNKGMCGISVNYYSDNNEISRPYHPQLAMDKNQKEDSSNMQVSNSHILWTVTDETTLDQSLYIRNFNTLRTKKICNSVAPYSKPILLSNHVVWEDNRDIESDTCAIYEYNLEEEREKLVYHDVLNTRLENTSNERFIIFFTYKVDSISTEYHLNIYDVLEGKIVNTFSDDFWNGGAIMSNYYRFFPKIAISEHPETPIIIWGTYNSNWKNDKTDSHNVAMFQIGVDHEPCLIPNPCDDGSGIIYPLEVSDEYILSGSEKYLWLSKIAKDRSKIASRQVDELDSNIKINFAISNTIIKHDIVTWSVPEYKDHFNEQGVSLYFNINGSNICWARLSEIFPDDELAGAMGE